MAWRAHVLARACGYAGVKVQRDNRPSSLRTGGEEEGNAMTIFLGDCHVLG